MPSRKITNWRPYAISILTLVFGFVTTLAADPVTEANNPTSQEMAAQSLSESEIFIAKSAHFNGPDGTDVLVPSGIYTPELESDLLLQLSPREGEYVLVVAERTSHEESIDKVLVLSDEASDDEFHVLLLLPDGTAYDAIASFSGVTERSARRRVFDKAQISSARVKYNRVSPVKALNPTTGVQSGATGTTAPVPSKASAPTATPQILLVPGQTVSYRFERPPAVNAYSARLVDPRTRRPVASSFANPSVTRGNDSKTASNGQAVLVPFVKVTVNSTTQLAYGDYQLWLLDKSGQPLVASINQTTGEQVKLTPIRVTAIANAQQKAQAQQASIATAGTRIDNGRVSDAVPDSIREMNRANQAMDKLAQLGPDGMPGLDPGGLSGSGLMLSFGREFRAGFISQLGGFPDGDFTGTLAGVGGTPGSGSTGGGKLTGFGQFQPSTGDPSKNASVLQGGGSVGDPRLMAGEGSSGGTFTIESSSTDTTSSSGSQKITDSITVKNHDDGSTFTHTMTHESNSNDGTTTETQTATLTDSKGNTTTETTTTTTTTDDEGNTTTTTTTTDDKGNTTTSSTTTPAADPASTPDPEGGDCTGQQCEKFKEFSAQMLFALQTNRIQPQQGADTMSQPGEGTSTPGDRTNGEIEKAAAQRLNPLILHDNAGSSTIPIPAGTQSSPPIRQDPGTLVDPPRDGSPLTGARPVIPTSRGASPESSPSNDENEEDDEQEPEPDKSE
jgi:hypothetical protein